MAVTGPEAYKFANSMARLRTSLESTTSLTKPRVKASSAFTLRPVKIKSLVVLVGRKVFLQSNHSRKLSEEYILLIEMTQSRSDWSDCWCVDGGR
jgi:hypothetical protein